MKKRLILLTLSFSFLLLLSGCRSSEQVNTNLKEDLQKMLNRHIQNYKNDFPGETIGFGLYVKGSNEVYASAGFPESMGEKIHFRGASTSKTFTAAAILKLYQQNKINIDDLITANIPATTDPYVPTSSEYAVPYKNQITIRLLLQHRAGVFDVSNTDIPANVSAPYAGKRYIDYVYEQFGDNHTFTLKELINVAASNQLSYFVPGTNFHYSNTGYNLLAVIVERVSGKRLDQYIQDEFLTPLKMNNTRFPYLGDDQLLKTPYLPGWLKYEGEIIKFDEDNLSSAVSEGNVNTTPRDLATWAFNLYGTENILNRDIRNQMLTFQPSNDVNVNYGLGAVYYPEDLGYGHDGVRPAFMTVMRYEPNSKTSFVLFSNFLNFDKVGPQNMEMHQMMREALEMVKAAK